jgi:16S rRNA (cytosine967-C5)-methyltransferase
MTPAARVQAAIEILDGLDKTAQPADRYVRDWFRARRYAGAKDRAAVAERVYNVLRHRASFAWRVGAHVRSLALASLLHEGQSPEAIEALFSGAPYAPPPLSDAERHALVSPAREEPPAHVKGEYPEWLEPELKRAFGSELPEEMQAMLARAPVDLRVNTLRANRDDMLVGLSALGIKGEPMTYAPDGIRIATAEGLSTLQHTQFFETGAFEFQDEGSQIVGLLCGVKPGDQVLDLAAGAGGKSLALAAIMDNKGEILAFDIDAARLREVRPRARRAGAGIVAATDKRGGPGWGSGKFDMVLIDAPCSGSGTWRRNPELKWRLTPQRLKELTGVQAQLLDDGARHTKSGGRVVYATCSLLPSEDEDGIAAFLGRNPDFRVIPAAAIWRELGLAQTPPGMGEYFRASPLKCATDGFFVCIMRHI